MTNNLNSITRSGIAAFYFLAVLLISYTLISEHESVKWLYFLFPASLILAYASKRFVVKKYASLCALAVLVVGGLIEPLELDAIEESFILLPLCYIILFPGSLWPIAVGFILILSYIIDLPSEDFDEFIEDAIEVLFITVFATVMTYFQQKAKSESKRYMKASLTDHLTKLQNRKSFFIRLNEIAKEASEGEVEYAVIQIGLDSLKKVNDDLGYGYGDELLKNFALHVRRKVGHEGEVYRLGGDELVLIIPCHNKDFSALENIVNKLESSFGSVCRIHNTSHSLRYCGGVAFISDAQYNVKVWGKNADAAVANAKRHRDGKLHWYDDELMDSTIRMHQIEIELQSAIDNDQLYLDYQPKIDVHTGEIVGAEALLRWKHPELGIVPPNDFIGIAEKTAQIIPIGRWVLEQAIRQAASWRKAGFDLCLSVNVSSIQFSHDEIYPYIAETLRQYSLPPNALQIEITETAMMDTHSKVEEICSKLQRLGLTVAIDDFGVAYSSLNYLKKLPIDVLKIDKSFIDDCVEEETDHMIVRTIIQMGHNLGKIVVAEGVETTEQLEILRREKCNHFQGYLFSKPISSSDFRVLLSEHLSDR